MQEIRHGVSNAILSGMKCFFKSFHARQNITDIGQPKGLGYISRYSVI